MGMSMPVIKYHKSTPLAAILRPTSLDDIVGQSHLLGDGMPLRKMIQNKKFQSIIFWGPTGVGKTSIVRCLANESDSIFRQLNATNATVKELRTIIKEASEALEADKRTFVFVDECHRWNKAQQDVLLPVVEDGTIVLFGATTERPKFAVNSTLLSRCLVLEVKPLNDKGMIDLIKRVRTYYKSKNRNIKFDKDATRTLINRCSGDARKMVTALETIIEILSDNDFVSEALVDQAIPDKHIVFDANGNDHFDLAHCYQEAIQNSDVDGAIYWLAKWISSGEDPAYICRRMLITAFEDCAGNPFAATTAMAATFATERTGLPECMIPMALATCEMAMSDRNKSAYYAISEAMADVQNDATVHVPPGLRAGSVGYVKAVKKTYLKGWSRDWGAIDRNVDQKGSDKESVTMYAIGVEYGKGEYGMTHGPLPDLKALTREAGEKDAYILQFRGEKTDVLYRWDVEEFEWVSVDERSCILRND